MQDHFLLFGPADLDRDPTPAELLSSLAAAAACCAAEKAVTARHVRDAATLLRRASAGPPRSLIDPALTSLRQLFASGTCPPWWSPAARELLAPLAAGTRVPVELTLALDPCLWGDPAHQTLARCLSRSESERWPLVRVLARTAQGLALSDGRGVVLPRDLLALSQLLVDLPWSDRFHERALIRSALRDSRTSPPGLRFHPRAAEALISLVDRLIGAHPGQASLETRVRELLTPTPFQPSRQARSESPAFAGLPLGWHGEAIAIAGSRKAARPILHNGEGHLLTIAPTGAGKGVGAVIPALLSHEGSAIVVDPKGENYAVTARFRRKLGQQVCVLDPFGVTGAACDRLNPLERLLDPSPSRLEHAKKIVDLLCPVPEDCGSNTWWYHRRAELLVSGLVLSSLDYPLLWRGLRGWLGLYAPGSADLEKLLAIGGTSKDDEVRIAAEAFSSGSVDARKAAMMGVTSALGNLLEEPVLDCMGGRSTLNLADVRDGQPITVYLVLPPTHLSSHKGLLRLWLGLLLESVLDRKKLPEQKTLFLIDEAAQLGRMELLLTAITLARGYGLSTWTFWQHLGQLQRLYPDEWRTIVNNCAVHQHFGIPYLPEAERVANLYPGVDPCELLRLGPTRQLLIGRDGRPVVSRRVNYLRDAAFAGRYEPNPMHRHGEDASVAHIHTLHR